MFFYSNFPRVARRTAALLLAVWSGLVIPVEAGTLSVSSSNPAVNGFDIANFGARTGDDKFFSEAGTAAGKAKGQTFRTRSEATWLRSVSYKTISSGSAAATKTYTVRLGRVTGTTFTQTHTETFTQTIAWGGGQWMTFTFTSPVLLLGDTTYGMDIGMTSTTSTWQTGIPYLATTDDDYTGGQLYNTGGTTAGVGGNTVAFSVSQDRLFHLNIEAPNGTPLAFIAGNPPDSTSNNLIRPELIATFNQPLSAGTGNIIVRDITDTASVITTTIPVGDPRLVLTANLLKISTGGGLIQWGKKYAIRINAGALLGTGGAAFAGWSDDTTWNFNLSAADPLLAAIAALKNHLNGTTVLDAPTIAAHSVTLNNEKVRFAENATTIAAVFDLVTTYDTEVGPLWHVGADLTREDEANDLPWTISRTMQAIIDQVYKASVLAQHEALFTGYKFGSSVNFPGACPTPPAGQTRTVAINASFPNSFGRDTQMWTEPARRPTGTYLHPGGIATVTVPAALVGNGYQIRVGAHSWDHSNRPVLKRLDRSTLVYNINAATTKIASPLGGGIYIEVPKGKTLGVQNVTITGAARSPFFSAKSFHQTTLTEWQTIERTQPAPWADFQSEKFMFQVPRSWIFAYADPITLMQKWDQSMDTINDLMGFPRIRGKETMYDQVDVQLRASVYAPGYPACNASFTPGTTYSGNHTHYLLTGPQNAPDYEFHEAGHAYFFPKFDGEQESAINLLHIAVQTQVAGESFDQALRESNGMTRSFVTLPNTAVLWMTSFNFSPKKAAMGDWEKSYQPQGHAKFCEVARMFGWSGLDAFFYFYNEKDHLDQTYATTNDAMTLQLCKSVGRDLRPLLHFWGIPPASAATLGNSITAARLKPTVEIYDRIMQYKALIPTNNATYRTWCTNWWGAAPSISGFGVEREHARQWSTTLQNGTAPQERFPNEEYNEGVATQIHARVQELLDLYYPTGRPSDYAAWDSTYPGVDLTNANADLDRDGMTNGEERIWGLDPTSPSSSKPITNTAALRSNGNLTYTRRTTTLSGLTYTVWTSTNLSTWTQDTGATQTVNSTTNNVQTVTVKLSNALLSQPKRFVRVQAAGP